MTDEKIAELRKLVIEYKRIESLTERTGVSQEVISNIAKLGIQAIEALPELLDYIQQIEDARTQLLDTIIDQYKTKKTLYDPVQPLNNNVSRYADASMRFIDGIGCFYHENMYKNGAKND